VDENPTFFRGDSHFAKPKLLHWLEGQDIYYAIGLAKNRVLERLSELAMADAKKSFDPAGGSAPGTLATEIQPPPMPDGM